MTAHAGDLVDRIRVLAIGERVTMGLEPGTRLGPYEILSPLGEGGMGEVYRAKDTRLDREVAVKVLPQHLSMNPDVRARFEREARAISSLNHPHICSLFDVGHEGDVEYLVMELVQGETLAARLAKGPLPLPALLQAGIEIADALDRAHKQGIVHRDLKPGNIMLTKSGVKLLDFGLAKQREAVVQNEISQLTSMPTEASPSRPLTEQGTILGTFQYMAPEQLEGGETDARTDIFALGCVLYEMAAGKRPFSGKSRASLIGSILKEAPSPISSIQPMTPPALDRLVQTCLAKEPEDRFQTAHDVKLQLQWIAEGGSEVGAPAVVVHRRKSRERLAWALTGICVAAAAALGVGFIRRAPVVRPPVRFTLVLPDGMVAVGSPRISPDGRVLAFSATDSSGKAQVWVRPLETLEPRPVPGTEGVSARPFWSPDSRFIGFIADGKLKKVDLSGAPSQALCDAPSGADGAWSKDGVILFDGTSNDPIRRVAASGGTPQVAIQGGDGVSVGWPCFLPDGIHFLYMEWGSVARNGRLMAGSLARGEKAKQILVSDSLAQYAPPGFLLYVKEGTLVGQSFDAPRLRLKGEPVPIAEGMGTDAVGLADFSVSADGVLVYRGGTSNDDRLVWVDRTGKPISEVDKPADYDTPALSPDGQRLAVSITDPRTGKADIWIRDLVRGVTSRFTFDPGNNTDPAWSPDGSRIVFSSDGKGTSSLFQKAVSGAGSTQELWSCGEPLRAGGWSRDGRLLSVHRLSAKNSWDVWVLPMTGAEKPYPFVESPFIDIQPEFSPDGGYIAYASNESGRFEVYVRQFPGPGGKWQISASGGREPHWSADGTSLWYQSSGSQIVEVPVTTGAAFTAGLAHPLFDARLLPGPRRNAWQATRDGQRFLLLSPLEGARTAPMTMVLNWTSGLRN